MSMVNFNDYVNYANYDTGYGFSALLGGTANSSGNLLSDYAFIKNGSYEKLMKAYYVKQEAENAALTGDTPPIISYNYGKQKCGAQRLLCPVFLVENRG